jgi:hypothetical protein
MFLALESDLRQALWEATHKLPITQEMRDSHRFWENLWLGRKQRRSRAGARLKTLLKHFLVCMVPGHCDWDLLLDPFFLHFLRVNEQGFWYPGLGCSQPPASLDDALAVVDHEEPWRIQYRSNLADHPGSRRGERRRQI